MTVRLSEGDAAPSFDLPATSGRVSAASLAGRPYVLYFYPRDDTSGCTRQAIDFSAAREAFDALGVTVIGVSADSLASHEKFAAKHDLAIPLAADEEHVALEGYGVWVEKSMYGRKFFGIERSTFLIGADGRVARVWRKVKVAGHVDEVLQAARALAG